MIAFFQGFLAFFSAFFCSRYSPILEIIALRQQLDVLKWKYTCPHLKTRDRVFWILLHQPWPTWTNSISEVQWNSKILG